MGDFMKNLGYFMGETRTIFLLNRVSGILSILSLTMIFVIVLLALTGWRISAELVNALQKEAEISVYYSESLSAAELELLKDSIKAVEGVGAVTAVSAETAYSQMTSILGPDAKVLTYFDANPFDAYFEVRIQLERLDVIVQAIEKIKNIEYVRDNHAILEKLSRIAKGVTALGIAVMVAVCVSTCIITSHIIREGVHSHRDQINTLKLLGAPDWFIHAPFVMEGVLLTTVSGILAGGGFVLLAGRFGAVIPELGKYLPSVDVSGILQGSVAIVVASSVALGLLASFLGLRMVRSA